MIPLIHRRLFRTGCLAFWAILVMLVNGREGRAQSWKLIASMNTARNDFKCVELPDHTILAAGGENMAGALKDCEIYDPNTNTWRATGALNQGRYRFSMVPLRDGRVMAIGGLTDQFVQTTASCEIYDPIKGLWTTVSPLPDSSENVAGLTLPNGKVFIAGGLNAMTKVYQTFACLYDPTTNTMTRLPDMPIGCTGHVMFYSAPDDKVLVCGGEFGGFTGFFLRSSRVYSFKTGSWSLADSSIEPHDNGQIMAVTMPDNRPLLISGRTGSNSLTTNVEAFDWPTLAWRHMGVTARAQWHCYAFRVGDDSILLVGGSTPDYQNVSPHATWYRYSTATSWFGPEMQESRSLYSGLVQTWIDPEDPCNNSVVIYAMGGMDSTHRYLNTCEALRLTAYAPLPHRLDLASRSFDLCEPKIDTVSLTTSTCEPFTIDSIVATGPLAKAVTVSQLDTATVGNLQTTHLLVTLSDAAGVSVSTVVTFTVYGHAGTHPDSTQVTITFVTRPSRPALSPTKIQLTGTLCSPANGSLGFSAPTCDSLVIDSVHVPTAAGIHLTSSPRGAAAPGDSGSVRLSAVADTVGTFHTTARVFYHVASYHDSIDTGMEVSVASGTVTTAHIVMNDQRDVLAGDTITVPLWLTGPTTASVNGYRLRLSYNTDLLEILTPSYDSSLTTAPVTDKPHEITGVGATLFVPANIQLRTGRLLNLRFRAFLAPEVCTEVRLDELIFAPDDPTFSRCIQQTLLDSAEICVHARCGDPAYRSLWAGTPISLNAIVPAGDGHITIHYTSPAGTQRFDLLDVMGRTITTAWSENAGTSRILMDTPRLHSGAYLVRMVSGGMVTTRHFVVRK